jgi:predicted nucleic acid-binding protein
VTLVYFDSSALVKLVLEEDGSDVVAALWNGCDAALSSRLAYVEVAAAIAAAGRNHVLAAAEASRATADWQNFWASIRPVELTAAVEQHAGVLAQDLALRGADAIHLASALALGIPDLIMAVWDRRLHTAATTSGISVAPAIIN